MKQLILSLFLLLNLSACARRIEKAVSDVKYGAYEAVGLEKRDLFKREVENVREDQEDTGKAFKSALERLQEVYKVDGGELEREYKRLNVSYNKAYNEASGVSESIDDLDQVARDLFAEWEGELQQFTSVRMREMSQKKLAQTKTRYKKLYTSLRESEKKIAPVLARFKDQVMYLKHNLNAEAIGGLKQEGKRIQDDITGLIEEMRASSKQAEEFIKTL